MFHGSPGVHSNVSTSFNTINILLCVPHTNLKFQPRNNSHIYHMHIPLFNPNVHIVCILGRKLFSMSNLDYGYLNFVHNSITAAFYAIKETFILIVVAFQFSSCAFIHESPWHNCLTILRHSKYTILVSHARIPKTVHACFNIPLSHLHKLYPILMDVHHFTLQPSMNC